MTIQNYNAHDSKLILGLTYRCQCKCVHCSCAAHPVSNSKELTTKEVKTLLMEVGRLGYRGVNLFGGEPFLRSDFFEILDVATTVIPQVTIDSNGLLIDKTIAQQLKAYSIETLFVSLAGSTKQQHNLKQGADTFDRVVFGIKAAIKAYINTCISICAFKDYVHNGELERIISFAHDLGVKGVRIALPMCSGRWLNENRALLDPGEIRYVRSLAQDPFVHLVEEETGVFTHCHAFSGNSIYVSPYGEVQPCNFIPLTFGNIRNKSFELIVEQMHRSKFFQGGIETSICPMHQENFIKYIDKNLHQESKLVLANKPLTLVLHQLCNNNCKECLLTSVQMNSEYKDLADIMNFINDYKHDYKEIIIKGGEPSLHPQFYMLLFEIYKLGFTIVLHSNGRVFSSDKAVERIKKLRVRKVVIPLFHWDEQNFDETTRTFNSFRQTIQGIQNLVANEIAVDVEINEPYHLPNDSKFRDSAVLFLKNNGVSKVIKLTSQQDGEQKFPFSCNENNHFAQNIASFDTDKVKQEVVYNKQWLQQDDTINYDVILLYPSSDSVEQRIQFPFSVLQIAAPLLEKGLKVKVLDQRVTPYFQDLVLKTIQRSSHCICIGISCFLGPQVQHVVDISKAIKQVNPHLPIVYGGAFPSLMGKEVLTEKVADFVISGEGEKSFELLVEALSKEKSIEEIPGLIFKKDNGEIQSNPVATPLNMDQLPSCSYDLINIEQYSTYRAGIHWALYTSRGCPFACNFCSISSVHQRKWRAYNSKRVIDELKRVLQLGAVEIDICDDNFFVDLKRCEEIATLILSENLKFTWGASCRIDTILKIPAKLFQLFFKSGLRNLYIGAESGCDRVLELLGKKITKSDILLANKKLKEFDIVPKYIFMIGFPTETEDERQETLELVSILKEDNPKARFWRMNHYVPYPNTPLYPLAIAHGFQAPDDITGWSKLGWHRSELANTIAYQVGF